MVRARNCLWSLSTCIRYGIRPRDLRYDMKSLSSSTCLTLFLNHGYLPCNALVQQQRVEVADAALAHRYPYTDDNVRWNAGVRWRRIVCPGALAH